MYQNRKSRNKPKYIEKKIKFCSYSHTKGNFKGCSSDRKKKKKIKILEVCRFASRGVRPLSSLSLQSITETTCRLLNVLTHAYTFQYTILGV